MKMNRQYIQWIWMVLLLAACSKNNDPTPPVEPTAQQAAAQALQSEWELSSVVSKPEVVDESQLVGFMVTFTTNQAEDGGTFTSANTGGLLGAEGSWEFVGESSEQINLLNHSGVVGAAECQVSGSELTFSFTTPSEPLNARTTSIDGDFTLVLTKK